MTDEPKKKKRFFLKHRKSSALVVSIILHGVFIAMAVVFVAVQAIQREDPTFEAKEIPRQKMKLRKLQVPVKDSKKSQAPKLRKTLVSKPKTTVSIKMPEIVGVPGGIGYGSGTGLGGGVGFGTMDLFGGGRGSGNELIGTFYDLKQEPDGKPSDVGEALLQDKNNPRFSMASQTTQDLAMEVIDSFVGSGFNPRRLDDYFKAPKLKYAQVFMMPPMNAGAAPEAYGVQDQVEGSLWICHYTGQIAAPETGQYRFCGIGDDVLIVRVGRKVVLDACWPEHIGKMSSWESEEEDINRLYSMNSYKYGSFPRSVWNQMHSKIEEADGFNGGGSFSGALGGATVSGRNPRDNYMSAACRMVIGDWVPLRKGELVNIDILIGELPGGDFTGRLLIEQQGKEYHMVQSDAGLRPVLPIFKTVEIDDEALIRQMELDPNEMTLEGPVFGAQINKQ